MSRATIEPRPDLDDPVTTDKLHRSILAGKPFLKRLYTEFYRRFRDSLPDWGPDAALVELGSGAGFLKEIEPRALASDVLGVSGLDLRFSGTAMPFPAESIHAFFLLDTFHHIPDAARFLAEADRCLKPGGRVVMMEPANSLWGRFIYRNFHHEPFEPKGDWQFDSTGPLTSANGALPWIVFSRDKARFQKDFPRLRIRRFETHTPLRYLLSGGLSKPQFVPASTFPFWTGLERALSPLLPLIGMFYWIELEKTGAGTR